MAICWGGICRLRRVDRAQPQSDRLVMASVFPFRGALMAFMNLNASFMAKLLEAVKPRVNPVASTPARKIKTGMSADSGAQIMDPASVDPVEKKRQARVLLGD